MRRLFTASLLALAILAPQSAQALEPEDAKQLVIDRAIAHGVNPAMALCLVQKESRFRASARGHSGEYGLAQWLPGRGNAWDSTRAYQEQGIDIVREYENGNPDAPYYDADGLADMLSRGYTVRHWHWHSTIIGCE